jgi:hypothetical protein
MANLTGDFDVIAQFAVPAVNRVLAAMHRVERFPHSMSMRVDDTPQPTHGWRPSVLGVLDVFGDATVDHDSIRDPRPINIGDFEPGSANARLAAALGAIANLDITDLQIPPVELSNIQGKAQVQVSPPTIELNDPSGKTVTVKMEMIARYLPDQGTAPVAQFVRGELKVTAAINQVVSQAVRMIYVDVRGPSTDISFTPIWSSVPIGPQDLAGINTLIRNALRTGFLPSSSQLSENIGHVQFKAIPASPGSVSLLHDMDPEDAAGNPATATQSLISGSDGFAVGVGADYMRAAFKPTLDGILQKQIDPISHRFGPSWAGYRVTYTFTLVSASLEFENGKMVLVITGSAHTSSFPPDFNFTVKQDMTLQVTGDSAELHFGQVHVKANKTLINVALFFLGSGADAVAAKRDEALAEEDTQGKVREKLSASGNFGTLLQSLLTPAGEDDLPPLDVTLAYTSAEIRESGVILHGSITVPASPPPRVEYEPISATPDFGLPGTAVSGPDYSALKSWIPGGTIDSYEWHRQGSQGYTDSNKFVLLDQGPTSTASLVGDAHPIAGYSPMCLTVHGKRLTTSGPVTSETVTATTCGYRSFPIGDFVIDDGRLAPMIALTRRGAGGMVDVVGHAPATARSEEREAPNLVIHFADEVSGEKLGDMVAALHASKRADAPTALIIVAKPSRMGRLPFSELVTYAEDDGQMRRHYGVSPTVTATVVVGPSGNVLWKNEGPIGAGELAAILGKMLVRTRPPKPALLSTTARIDQRTPNFLFQGAPGQPLTLRKIGGRKIVLVFFNRSSEPSVDAVRDAIAGASGKTLVIAISDGEGSPPGDLSPAIVVPDRKREIAKSYGVTMWPTIISIDEAGIIRSIAYGRLTTGEKSRA